MMLQTRSPTKIIKIGRRIKAVPRRRVSSSASCFLNAAFVAATAALVFVLWKEVTSDPPSSCGAHIKNATNASIGDINMALQCLSSSGLKKTPCHSSSSTIDDVLTHYIRNIASKDNRGNFSKDIFVKPHMWNYVNLAKPTVADPSVGQSEKILRALKGKLRGKYVEVGAGDGEEGSPTLYLERWFGWSGILLEIDANPHQEILWKNRRSIISRLAVAKNPFPETVTIHGNYGTGTVPAIPLYSIMRAWEMTTVDLLYVDVNGGELKILSTVPWDCVNITLVVVDLGPKRRWMFKEVVDERRKKSRGMIDSKPLGKFLPDYFRNLGYTLVDELHDKWDDDYFFVKTSFLD